MTNYKKRQNVTGHGKPVRGISAQKVFLCALGVGIAGGVAYYLYEKRKKRQETENDAGTVNNNSQNIYNIFSNGSGNDSFPLKRGSKGARVRQLQQALKQNDPSIKVDSIFGKGTESALLAAGYGKKVDEALFNQIVSNEPAILFNPQELAEKLYGSAQSRNIESVLSVLKQIKDVSQYTAVNNYYKKQGFISTTIVTNLLDKAFAADSLAKQRIQSEFLRMGLKHHEDSGKWSLQGFSAYRDIITVTDTYIIDQQQNKIKVARNTILGDEQEVANGLTLFRAIDNTMAMVPTRDVKYV